MKKFWWVAAFLVVVVAAASFNSIRADRAEEAAREAQRQDYLDQEHAQAKIDAEREREEWLLEDDRQELRSWAEQFEDSKYDDAASLEAERQRFLTEEGTEADWDRYRREVAEARGCESPRVPRDICSENEEWADVIDGDTFTLIDRRRIRLAFIDAPELRPRAECFAKEAKNALQRILTSAEERTSFGFRWVSMRPAWVHPGVDQYGRLLREVSTQAVNENGGVSNVDVALEMVRTGFARYEPKWAEQYAAGARPRDIRSLNRSLEEFEDAEAEARAAGRGGWGACGW